MPTRPTTNAYQRTNATYAMLYAFEPDWGWLQQRQNKLDAYLQQGLTNGSRQVTSETLNVMGLELDAADCANANGCWRRNWASCRSIFIGSGAWRRKPAMVIMWMFICN